jgi:hypothetical protein
MVNIKPIPQQRQSENIAYFDDIISFHKDLVKLSKKLVYQW